MAAAAPLALHGMRVAIVGASLGGLAAANVLARLGASNVTVLEAHAEPFARRGGGLGADVRLAQHLCGDTYDVPRQLHRGTRSYYYGDLWKFLYDHLPSENVSVRFGVRVDEIAGADSDTPSIGDESYDLMVLADGGWSGLRRHVTKEQPAYGGYVLWRGLVKSKDAKDCPSFLGPGLNGARSGRVLTLNYPVRDPDGDGSLLNCGVYIAQPESENPKPAIGANRQVTPPSSTAPAWFLPLVEHLFEHDDGGQHVALWRSVLRSGKVAAHPIWEFAADRVVSHRVVLLGDSAHMASPNTGAGAHTAFVDAYALRTAFEDAMDDADASGSDSVAGISIDVDAALARYNRDAVTRARDLLRASLSVGRQYLPHDGSEPVSPSTLLPAGSLKAAVESDSGGHGASGAGAVGDRGAAAGAGAGIDSSRGSSAASVAPDGGVSLA